MALPQRYRTVRRAARIEYHDKKSRFIADCRPLADEAMAQQFIQSIQHEFPDATHHVYAYILAGETFLQRYSDNGEPQGTAGLPVLDVLRKGEILQAGIVVTRYFGGTLLGSGGLVHAYSTAARNALLSAEPLILQLCQRIRITLDYCFYDKIRHQMAAHGFYCESPRYSQQVELTAGAPPERLNELLALLDDLTAATARVEPRESAYLPLDVPG